MDETKENCMKIVDPEFRIPCNELMKSTYSTIDYQIDAFCIKIQEKYITNPILIRYQLENIFVKQLETRDIELYDDIITVIQSFLPIAPNMNNIHFVQTNYYLLKHIDGNDILRTEKSKKEKYFLFNRDSILTYYDNYSDSHNNLDENNKSKIIINYDQQNYLEYDFGEFCQINAILIKTNERGLGKQMIKIKIPNIYHQNQDDQNDDDNEWITHSILSISSYNDGWLGFVDLNILSQLIKLEFDANGAVINELLFI